MYQSEFPVDQPVPVFDPTLVFLLILAGLAITALAFFAGRLTGRGDKGEKISDVPKKIHDAIKARCVAATSAHSGELEQKIRELLADVKLRIGPLLSFGGPCAKAFKHLSDALDGKVPEEKPKDPAHDHHGAHGAGEHGAAHETASGHEPSKVAADDSKKTGGVEVLSRNVTIVGSQTVLLAALKPDDHGGGHPPVKALDRKEFNQLLRLAAAEFSDFWNRPECLGELKACQEALTRTPETTKLKLHDDAHH